jgi:hypothetical protein
MSKQLTSQIVLRVLEDIGIIDLNNQNSWVGLGSEQLLTNRVVKIKYTDKEHKHQIYAGQLKLNDFNMKGILVDLSYTGNDVLFLFRSGDKPIHAINCVDDGDIAFIKIYNEKSNMWKDTTIQMQAQVLTGFEQITSLGILWDTYKEYEDLYGAAVNLISIMD